MADGVVLVRYADIVALLITARDVDLTQIMLNQTMGRVHRWMEGHNLTLVLNKTEIVILSKKRMVSTIPLRLGGMSGVTTSLAVRYLGVMMDTEMTSRRASAD